MELSTDQRAIQAVARALKDEADGKKLRRQLAREMRDALKPAVAGAKAGVLGMASGGLDQASPGLRPAIARGIQAQARLTGRSTGAKVRARQVKVRGFKQAPRRTNREGGWRHRVFGRDVWVHQTGRPGWFDDEMKQHVGEYRDAVLKAVEDMARRIAARARS